MVVLAICGALSLALRSRRLALHITGMLILPVVCWLVLLVSLDRWYVVRYTSAGLPAFILLVAIGTVSPIMSLEAASWSRSPKDMLLDPSTGSFLTHLGAIGSELAGRADRVVAETRLAWRDESDHFTEPRQRTCGGSEQILRNLYSLLSRSIRHSD